MLVERNAAMVAEDGDLLPAGGRPPPDAADDDSGRSSSGGEARRFGDHRFLDRSGDRRIADHSKNRFEDHSWACASLLSSCVVGVVAVAVEAGSQGETTLGVKVVTHKFGFGLRGCWAIETVRRHGAEGEGRGVQKTGRD